MGATISNPAPEPVESNKENIQPVGMFPRRTSPCLRDTLKSVGPLLPSLLTNMRHVVSLPLGDCCGAKRHVLSLSLEERREPSQLQSDVCAGDNPVKVLTEEEFEALVLPITPEEEAEAERTSWAGYTACAPGRRPSSLPLPEIKH